MSGGMAWTYEQQLAHLEELDRTLLVEKPVFRGQVWGCALMDAMVATRMLQASRLKASGWSNTGLAMLYRVSRDAIERWVLRLPGEAVRARSAGDRPMAQKVAEAIALVQVDCWEPENPPGGCRWERRKRNQPHLTTKEGRRKAAAQARRKAAKAAKAQP